MIIAALLLSIAHPASPACAHDPASWSVGTTTRRVEHVFQNGEPSPVRLWWIDPQGRPVDLGAIAPGALRSIATHVGHSFAVTGAADGCRTIRIGDVFSGTYLGTSRYRAVATRPGWHVLIDRALDPNGRPARTALTTLARLLAQVEVVLPPASLAQVRTTPIFLPHEGGPRGMFHYSAQWLTAHGRTVEMVNAIELSDAQVFVETVKTQPGAVLHELAHGYHARLSDADRADVDAAYRGALESGRYRRVKRHDGSVGEAYATSNAAEYLAELSEAYFGRNDFYPFTRADLVAHDPDGARLMARLWR